MTFVAEARAAAAEWKRAAPLPEEARMPAPYARRPDRAYAFCLPPEYAKYNLLEEARTTIALFARDEIAWHDGFDGGPSNHLLDSQVQCVNALAPFVHNGSGLAHLFGGVLDIAEMLPFFADHDSNDLVVFEWIGGRDYLGERRNRRRQRGTKTTSADAAIRYKTSVGAVEVALIEWKYTEQYHGDELSGDEQRMAKRHDTYRALYDDPHCPVRQLIPYEDLFVEPIYQLFRLTLLADQMERAHEQRAERVRLVCVAPRRNRALWTSLNRVSHGELAARLVDDDADTRPVEVIWSAMCRHPERFVYLDSATFVAAGAPTSKEFKARYGHLDGAEVAPSNTRQLVQVRVPELREADWGELSWDGPWAAWLPLAWTAANSRAGIHSIPEAPPTDRSVESLVGPIAWWTPLPHLLGYSFGWSDLAHGLHAWQELGRPIDDPRFDVIAKWWGEAAIGLAYWLEMKTDGTGARASLDALLRSLSDRGQPELAAMINALVEGGSDPLHLSTHAPIPPLETPNNVADTAAHVLRNEERAHAVVVFDCYLGWYEGLVSIGADLATTTHEPVRSIDVLCRDVGWLGRYRCSPVTGRWFAGPHRLHLLGQV